MFYDLPVAAARFLARELSFVSRTDGSRHLNTDELSPHLLRDLGLLDGREEDGGGRGVGRDAAQRFEELILTPRAS